MGLGPSPTKNHRNSCHPGIPNLGGTKEILPTTIMPQQPTWSEHSESSEQVEGSKATLPLGVLPASVTVLQPGLQ